MKLKNLPIVVTICVVVCVLVSIGYAVLYSWEAQMAMTLPLEFTPTEFSDDDGATWTPADNGEHYACSAVM